MLCVYSDDVNSEKSKTGTNIVQNAGRPVL